ncbi:30S ribosomal protein S17 [Candidatus Woesearchaeota archaeon]|nr:30S ribosomal protein S17 [Candidatus Woesearchaeota archaeon]
MNTKVNIGLDVPQPKSQCVDNHCPFHSNMGVRGRIFSGIIVSKDLNKTAIIEWIRPSYLRKYERYEKRKTRLKVHNPPCIDAKINDNVKVVECRPISKTKKFVIISIL